MVYAQGTRHELEIHLISSTIVRGPSKFISVEFQLTTPNSPLVSQEHNLTEIMGIFLTVPPPLLECARFYQRGSKLVGIPP